MESNVGAFRYYGGVPGDMVYDNMRVAIKQFVGDEKNAHSLNYSSMPQNMMCLMTKSLQQQQPLREKASGWSQEAI